MGAGRLGALPRRPPLEGAPGRVVLDAASGQRLGAESVWGAGAPGGPSLWSCHHHLEASLIRALAKDGHRSTHDPLVIAARKALGGRNGWRAFMGAAGAASVPSVASWLADNGALVARQVARLHSPASVGALELALRRVKTSLYDRRFGFTNRARTDALLELMRLHQNGLDDERAYADAIEAHLQAHAGQLAAALAGSADPLNRPSLRSRVRTGTSRPRRRLQLRGVAADRRRGRLAPCVLIQRLGAPPTRSRSSRQLVDPASPDTPGRTRRMAMRQSGGPAVRLYPTGCDAGGQRLDLSLRTRARIAGDGSQSLRPSSPGSCREPARNTASPMRTMTCPALARPPSTHS